MVEGRSEVRAKGRPGQCSYLGQKGTGEIMTSTAGSMQTEHKSAVSFRECFKDADSIFAMTTKALGSDEKQLDTLIKKTRNIPNDLGC